jgi:superfamily I DNA/RNA helicase
MPDDREEAEFIANEIAQRCVTEGTKHEQFAVLFRMNAQSRLVEQNLRSLHIPYRVIGGKSFFDRREIKDLLAYASCLINTDDDVSLLRIINTPARGISPNTVERATEISARKKCSVFEALQDPDFRNGATKRAAESIDAFVSFLDGYETKLNEPLVKQAAILREFIKESGYLEDLEALLQDTGRGAEAGEQGFRDDPLV